MDTDTTVKVVMAVYCALGLPVAWLHLRQQKMTESVNQIQLAQGQALVVFTLAVMWPLLLLSMLLNYSQRRKPQSPGAKSTDELE